MAKQAFTKKTQNLPYMINVPEVLHRAAIAVDAGLRTHLDGAQTRMKERFEERWHYGWQPKDQSTPTEGIFKRDKGPIAHFSVHYEPQWYVEVRTMDPDGPMSVTEGDKIFVSELVRAINAASKEVFEETA